MPIDPNIALGVRGLEVPDPLNQLAKATQLEVSQMQLQELRNDRMEMQKFQQALAAKGGNPDLNAYADMLLRSPKHMQMGVELKQKLKRQSDFERILGGGAPAAPTAVPADMGEPAVAPVNAMAGGAAPVAPTAPVNAMAVAPAPYTPVVPRNAMVAPAGAPTGAAPVNAMAGSNQPMIAQAQNRINNLMQYASKFPGTPEAAQAMQQAKIVQDQLELYSKRDPNKPAALQELEAYMAMPPEQKAAFERLQKIKAPGSNTSVSISSPTGKSLSEPVGKRVEASLSRAEGASGMRENANLIQEALNTGKVIAGPMAGARTTVAQLLNMAGADNQAQLQNSLTVVKGLAGLTLESRGELKGQGQITDPETKLLEKARSGDMNLTLDELQQVVNISNRMSNRLWENHQNLLKTMEADPAAAGSINYYRPTAPLAQPIGSSKATSQTSKEQGRKPLADIFKK
jgi:hypothetical protein